MNEAEAEAEAEATQDAAPPTGRNRKGKFVKGNTASSSRSHKRKTSLETPIRTMLETVGGVWSLREQSRGHDEPTCGDILRAQAPDIAKALHVLSMEDPTVYKWLSATMTGGGWGSVVLTAWPVAESVLRVHVMAAVEARRAAREGEDVWGPPAEPSPTPS